EIAKTGRQFIQIDAGVDVTVLIAAPDDERIFRALPDLLQFRGIGREIGTLAVIEQAEFWRDSGKNSLKIATQRRYEEAGISQSEVVAQPAGQQERVRARTPFSMVAGKYIWLLLFLDPQAWIGLGLIEILAQIARFEFRIHYLDEKSVLRTGLNSGGRRNGEQFEI